MNKTKTAQTKAQVPSVVEKVTKTKEQPKEQPKEQADVKSKPKATKSVKVVKAEEPEKVEETHQEQVEEEHHEETSESKSPKKSYFSMKTDNRDELKSNHEEFRTELDKFRKEFPQFMTRMLHCLDDLYKRVDRNLERLEKEAEKKKSKKDKPRLETPVKASDALCDFMGLPHGSEVVRTDACKAVTSYVKEHSLNGKEVTDKEGKTKMDKRIINCDAKLTKLFGKTDDEVTYTNIFGLVGKHLTKKV